MHSKLDLMCGFVSKQDSHTPARLSRSKSIFRPQRKQEMCMAHKHSSPFPSETLHGQCPHEAVNTPTLFFPASACDFPLFAQWVKSLTSYCSLFPGLSHHLLILNSFTQPGFKNLKLFTFLFSHKQQLKQLKYLGPLSNSNFSQQIKKQDFYSYLH